MKQPVGFMSLPPEIRNKIMQLALAPGKFQILRLGGERSPRATVAPQLLATCSELYKEGRDVFYCDNLFILPTGRFWHGYAYFERLREDHRNLITKVGAIITSSDLPRLALEGVEFDAIHESAENEIPWVSGRGFAEPILSTKVGELAQDIWSNKIHYVRTFKNVQQTCFECPILKTENMTDVPALLCSSETSGPQASDIEAMIKECQAELSRRVRRSIQNQGWERTKDAIVFGKLPPMYGEWEKRDPDHDIS